MKIAVLVKQVPDTATPIKLTADARGIEETGVKWVVNPYDEFAIEAALQLKQQTNGEVIVVSAGPDRVVDGLRTALAMGADRAVRIKNDVVLDPYATAVVLAKVLAEEQIDLVLGGKQAVDDDAAQVIHGVAEKLGWPIVTTAETFTLDVAQRTVTAHRPLAGGLKEVVDVKLPVVIGCDKGMNQPRYPSLPGIMKAKAKPLAEKLASQLLAGETPKIDYLQYQLPPERSAGKKIVGSPDEVSDQLVAWLKTDVKIF